MSKEQPDNPTGSPSPYAFSDPELERHYQASHVTRDEALAWSEQKSRQSRWSSWLQGGWRDTLACMFSREAREEQRRWKQEREKQMAAFEAEQDTIYEKILRKVEADVARRERDAK